MISTKIVLNTIGHGGKNTKKYVNLMTNVSIEIHVWIYKSKKNRN